MAASASTAFSGVSKTNSSWTWRSIRLASFSFLIVGGCDHGDFDQIGGGALDDAVDGHALAAVADGEDAAVDVGDRAAAAEDGFDIAVVLGVHDALVEELANGGKSFVVGVDQFLGGGDGQAVDAPGQAVGGDAIDDAEVDDFRLAALIAGDLIQGTPKTSEATAR